MTPGQFVDRAIDVPFLVGGRDWSGWDCWGLVFIAYRELFGIDIPSLSDEYDEKLSFAELNTLVNTQKPLWNSVEQPMFGDVRLFKVSRYQSHVALVLPWRSMIHTTQGVGTVVERLDVITWAKRHVEYFRHEQRSGSGGIPSAQD